MTEPCEPAKMRARPGLFPTFLDGSISRSGAVSMVIQVAGLGLAFAQSVLVARLLGAEGYGAVAVAMSIVAIISTVCLFGLGSLSVREVPSRLAANDLSGLASFLRRSLMSVSMMSIVASIGVAVIAFGLDLDPAYQGVLAIGALLILPLVWMGAFRGVAQGFGRVALAQVPGDILRPGLLITLLFGALLLKRDVNPTTFMGLTAIATMVAAVLAAGALWRYELARLPAPAQGRAWTMRPALPFLGIGLAGLLEGEISTLLLGWFSGPYETGIFQPVMRLMPLILLPAQAILMAYAPRVAELWERGDRDGIRRITRFFTVVTTAMAVGIGATIIIAGPWLLGIFGSEFREGAPLLWLLVGAQVFNAACGPVGWLLMMSNRSGLALAGQVGGLAVNFGLGWILVPTHGAWGAAIGMTGGIVTWNMILLVIARSHLQFDPSLLGVLVRRGA